MTSADAERLQAGLCAACLWVRRVSSSRGRQFYLCERSVSEPDFPKYPVLPVRQCRGFEQADGDPARSITP